MQKWDFLIDGPVIIGLGIMLLASGAAAQDITGENLTIGQTAQFGTVFNGVASNNNSSVGYVFNVAQATIANPVEITQSSWVDGYSEYQWVNQDIYGWIDGGYWEDYYNWGITGSEWIPAVYDEFGTEIQSGYYQDIWGNVWAGQNWVPNSYWGITGTEAVMQEVWIPGYTNTWTEYVDDALFGAPRLQLSATRSDANWVWRNPSASNPGEFTDIMVLWNGGLRIPSPDPARMMALSSESLSQSISFQDGSTTGTLYTKVGADSLEAKSQSVTADSGGDINFNQQSKMEPNGLVISQDTSQGGVSQHLETTINPAVASFGGTVQVKGALDILGGLKVAGQSVDDRFLTLSSNTIYVGGDSYAQTRGIALGEKSTAANDSISIGYAAGGGSQGTIVPGIQSLSLGYQSLSTGGNAVAIGSLSSAGGLNSIALGPNAKALALRSVAIGQGTEANQTGQIVLGAYNAPSTPSSMISSDDDLLIVGNGASAGEVSNALILKRSGDLHVKGSLLTVDGDPVMTQTAVAAQYFPLSRMNEVVTMASAEAAFQPKAPQGTHYVLENEIAPVVELLVASSETAQRLISNDLYLSIADAQTDYLTKAEAGLAYVDQQELDAALGSVTTSGEADERYLQKTPLIGLTYGTSATAAAHSIALGNGATASGTMSSSAVGDGAVANNIGTHAIGTGTVANVPDQTVVGTYNDHGTTLVRSADRAADDAVFVVGVGTPGSSGERKNALEVKRNGEVEISGVLRVRPAGNLSMGEYNEGPQP